MPTISRFIQFLSTSPARGTTHSLYALLCNRLISIHVPREGDDPAARGQDRRLRISIHVPREGDDTNTAIGATTRSNFYPRPPRGGRRF